MYSYQFNFDFFFFLLQTSGSGAIAMHNFQHELGWAPIIYYPKSCPTWKVFVARQPSKSSPLNLRNLMFIRGWYWFYALTLWVSPNPPIEWVNPPKLSQKTFFTIPMRMFSIFATLDFIFSCDSLNSLTLPRISFAMLPKSLLPYCHSQDRKSDTHDNGKTFTAFNSPTSIHINSQWVTIQS